MSRQDIADYLGLTIETVSRTLTHLENSRRDRAADVAPHRAAQSRGVAPAQQLTRADSSSNAEAIHADHPDPDHCSTPSARGGATGGSRAPPCARSTGSRASELARVAQDAGLNAPQLRTLAGKWPDSADLLSQRLAALQLDEDRDRANRAGRPARPAARLRPYAGEKPHCGPTSIAIRAIPSGATYCPNVETLDALAARALDAPARSQAPHVSIAIATHAALLLLIVAAPGWRDAGRRAIAGGATRPHLRADALRAVSRHRQDEPEPARRRAAVPDAAYASIRSRICRRRSPKGSSPAIRPCRNSGSTSARSTT